MAVLTPFLLATPAAALLGVVMSLSAAMNGQVGKRLGIFPASFVYLGIGAALCLPFIVALERGAAQAVAGGLAWYLYLPGLINIFFIANLIFVVNRLGTMLMTSVMFFGQVLVSIVLDHLGFLGLTTISATPVRLFAALVLTAGIAIAAGPPRRGRRTPEVAGRPLSSASAVAAAALAAGAPTAEGGLRPPAAVPATGGVEGVRGLDAGALALALAFLQGCALAVVNALNAVLGQLAGTFTSTFLYLAPGAVFVAAWFALARRPLRTARVRPGHLLPGALNVVAIAGTVVLVPIVGLQFITAALVTAAVLSGLYIDRQGLFGLPRQPVSSRRVLATLVLAVGVVLTVLG